MSAFKLIKYSYGDERPRYCGEDESEMMIPTFAWELDIDEDKVIRKAIADFSPEDVQDIKRANKEYRITSHAWNNISWMFE